MFTTMDKAIAAGLGVIAYFLTAIFGSDFGLTPAAITNLTGVIVSLLPVLVYLVPNLKKEAQK